MTSVRAINTLHQTTSNHKVERVQKVALKIILKENYQTYENALNVLDLETLKDR